MASGRLDGQECPSPHPSCVRFLVPLVKARGFGMTPPGAGAYLAAGLEAAGVGDGHAQVLVGIDRSVVDTNFVVKVRAGGAAAGADVADGIAAMNLLAGGDGESGKMAVAGRDAVAVVEHDGLAVSAHEVGEGDNAVGGSDHRMAVAAADRK